MGAGSELVSLWAPALSLPNHSPLPRPFSLLQHRHYAHSRAANWSETRPDRSGRKSSANVHLQPCHGQTLIWPVRLPNGPEPSLSPSGLRSQPDPHAKSPAGTTLPLSTNCPQQRSPKKTKQKKKQPSQTDTCTANNLPY